MSKIEVQGTEITVIHLEEKDYISLTDMVRNLENGLALIEKWLGNKNTFEFLGIWEEMYNPDFNSPEFEGIKNEAGLNRFVMSVKQWVEKTRSKGIIAKAGRYGGTYSHKDIAFEFASWVSPQFKLYLIKEFQRLKDEGGSMKDVMGNMSEWKEVTLNQYIKVKHGFAFNGNGITDEDTGKRLVTPGNLNIGGGYKSSKFRYFKYQYPAEYEFSGGEIVVTMTDLSKETDALGYAAKVPNDKGYKYLHNQRVGLVEFANEDIYQEFAYWLMRTYEYHWFIVGSASCTSIMHTSPSRIGEYTFLLPPLPEQKAIASVLSSLDDKIDLLHHQNKTLEALAETLFRQWFVEEADEEWEEVPLSFFADKIRENVKVENLSDHENYVGLEHIPGKRVILDSWGATESINTDVYERIQLVDKIVTHLNSEIESIDNAFKKISEGKEGWSEEQNNIVEKLLANITIKGEIHFNPDEFYKGLTEILNGSKFRATGTETQDSRIRSKFNVSTYEDYIRLLKNEKTISKRDDLISINEFYEQKEYFLKGAYNIYQYLYLFLYRKNYLNIQPIITYMNKSPDKLSVGQCGTFYVCMKLATDPFGSPFVFDQPEDDLDNDFIMKELVPIFRSIKKYQQVIIATHNANLVVNADAEQVIVANNTDEVLSYDSVSIENTSTIEPLGIRERVCNILEGGDRAFKQREMRYAIKQ